MDQPKLIHGELFMMGLLSLWACDIPDFDTYLKHQLGIAKQRKATQSG